MIKRVETSSTWNGGAITRDMYTELQDSMVESAERIAEKARSLVPVGPGDPKHLRDTIRARGKRKKGVVERLVHGAATGDYERELPGAFVFAGERDEGVYWMHWVEFGTYEQPAHPYMRPAVDANFNATLAEAEHAGRRVVNKRRRSRARRRRLAQGGSR